VTQVSYPDGGSTTNCYTDSGGSGCTQSGPPFQLVSTKKINATQNIVTTVVFDGLGRATQTQLNSDPQGTVLTDRTYDPLGRVATISNPHRTPSDATTSSGTTTYFYDALGRKCLEVPPDGTLPTGGICPSAQPANTILTTYSGNTTTVTDQTGKS